MSMQAESANRASSSTLAGCAYYQRACTRGSMHLRGSLSSSDMAPYRTYVPPSLFVRTGQEIRLPRRTNDQSYQSVSFLWSLNHVNASWVQCLLTEYIYLSNTPPRSSQDGMGLTRHLLWPCKGLFVPLSSLYPLGSLYTQHSCPLRLLPLFFLCPQYPKRPATLLALPLDTPSQCSLSILPPNLLHPLFLPVRA